MITRHSIPTDTYFDFQWHLLNTGQSGSLPGIDLNVTAVWDEFDGAGVDFGVWDDGIDAAHHDLDDNYDASLHIVIDGVVHDPTPEDSGSEHGTAVAGVIAAEANGTGTVGVAYGATVTGVDMFYDPQLFPVEAFDASFMELDNFDVTNHSWGWTTPFADSDSDPEWRAFFDGWQESVVTGRGGLGTINVKSAGNGRLNVENANGSYTTSMPEVIAVAAVANDGFVSYYSTPGASVLVSAPSSGGSLRIWTTDRIGAEGYSDGATEAPLNADPDYTSGFGGTSSAAPAVAGVVGLMLEANPDLGWRDVQIILAHTARHVGTTIGGGLTGAEQDPWVFNAASTWNGGGLHFSNDYGFGMVDALAAVRLAESWTRQQTSANWLQAPGGSWVGDELIPDNDPVGYDFTIDVTEAVDIERIGLRAALSGFTGDYRIEVTSPGGTTNTLATEFNDGSSTTGDWLYVSNAFHGENSVGTWQVHVSDRWALYEGRLTAADLLLFGAPRQSDDILVFTNEFSDYAGAPKDPRRSIEDLDGGVDTINAAAVTMAATIDLAAGTGVIDGVDVSIARGVENVFTGDGADRIHGDALANRLEGGRGADLIRGGRGGDHLNGGIGADEVRGDAGDDVARGGRGADLVFGAAGDDRVHGGRGDDLLYDGDGRDILYGYRGRDGFVLSVDGDRDRVRDYQDNIDKIWLSGFDFDSLSFARVSRSNVRIDYGPDEVLVTAASGRLAAGTFTESDFVFV